MAQQVGGHVSPAQRAGEPGPPLAAGALATTTEGDVGAPTVADAPEPGALGPMWWVAAAVVVAALAVAAAAGSIPWASAAAVVALVPAGLTDVRWHRLPDRWVGLAVVTFVVLVVVEPDAARFDPPAWGGIAVGVVAMAGPLLVLHLVSPSAMGFGDVKAAAVLGAALGAIDPWLSSAGLAVAAGVGATFGIVAGRRTIAFGPPLIGAAALCLAAHPLLLDVTVGS